MKQINTNHCYQYMSQKLILLCLSLLMVITLGSITNTFAEETKYSAYTFEGNKNRRIVVKYHNDQIDANWSFCINSDRHEPGNSSGATGTYTKIINPTEAVYKANAQGGGGDYKKVKAVLYYYATHAEYNYVVVQNELYTQMGISGYDSPWNNDNSLKEQKETLRNFVNHLTDEESKLIDERTTFYLYHSEENNIQNLITCKVKPFESKFIKKDSATKRNLAGAKIQFFKVTDSGKQLLDQNGHELRGDNNTTASWTSTADEETFVIPEEGTYIIHELSAPAGYNETDDIVFKMDAFGRITIGNYDSNNKAAFETNAPVSNITTYTFVMNDVPETGKEIEIGKINGAGKPLAGATIVIKQGDATIKRWTTDTANKTFKIAPGTYTFHESSAPKDYQCVKDFDFTVDGEGRIAIDSSITYASVNGNKLVVTDDHQPIKVTVYKTWDSGTVAKAVKLQLYVDGKTYGDPVTLKSSDGKNWSYSWNEVPYSYGDHYVVKEENSDVFYPIETDNHTITYYEKYSDSDFKSLENGTQIMLVNRSTTQALGLQMSQISSDHAPLEWKTVNKYNDQIVNAPSADSLWTIQNNRNGVVALKNSQYSNLQIVNVKKSVDLVMAGTTTLAWVNATQVHFNKQGYLQIGSGAGSNWSLTQNTDDQYATSNYFSCSSNPNIQFDVYVRITKTVSESENEKVITLTNKAYEKGNASLKIRKKDSRDAAKYLAGATFTLYRYDNSVTTKIPGSDLTGRKVDTGTTNSEGSYTFEKLPFGEYYLVEEEAPSGYEKLTEPIQIHWVKDGDSGKAIVSKLSKSHAKFENSILEIANDQKKVKSLTVQKGWDIGTTPQDIQVTLYKDGKKAAIKEATVTLTAEKHYQYTWKNLDYDGTYTVLEDTKSKDFASEVSPSSGINTYTKVDKLSDLVNGDQVVLMANQATPQVLGVQPNASSHEGKLRLVTPNTGSLSSSTLYTTPTADTLWTITNKKEHTAQFSNVKYRGLKIANKSGEEDSFVSADSSLITDMYYDSQNRLRFGYGDNTYAMTYDPQIKQFTCTAPSKNTNQLRFDIYKVNTVKDRRGEESLVVINNKSTTIKKASIKLKKFEAGDTTKLLKNAKFQLYIKNENSATNIPHTSVYGTQVGDTLTTNEDGTLSVSGLNVDTTYYFVETKAPEGYKALDQAIGFTVSVNGDIELVNSVENVMVSNDVLLVGNTKSYVLPDTGGTGIFSILALGFNTHFYFYCFKNKRNTLMMSYK